MKQLTLYFIIASLASACSGQDYTKSYEYSNKDLIHAVQPFAGYQVVYGVCEGIEAAEKKCKIYQEPILVNRGGQSCDLNLTDVRSHSSNLDLQTAGKDHVIVAVQVGAKVKLMAVDMKTCSVKETSVVTEVNSSVDVVPRDDNYDVFFTNSEICKDSICKATYDYDGKIVKEAAAALPVKSEKDLLVVNPVSQGLLVYNQKVYFVHDGDSDAKVLFSSPDGSTADIYSSSTENDKLGYCLLISRKLMCQQFDAEGKTKNLEIEKPITVGSLDAIDVMNLEKGLLVLTIERPMRSNGQPPAVIVKYDDKGNPVKTLSADLNCREGGFSVPKLYKNSSGEFCVSSVCRQYLRDATPDSQFSRYNKCFAKTELD